MRSTVAIVVLLSLTVAGCIGGPAAQSGEEQDWPTISDPKNFSYDTDSGFHVHDYWGGKDVLDVLNQTKHRIYDYPVATGNESDRFVVPFLPADGNVVPQGTAFLEVTVSWEEGEPMTSYGRLELWAKPANASEPELVEEDLEDGGTIRIPLDYEEADLPHQVISNWEFQVHIRGSDDPYNRWVGSVTVQVEAHRGLELKPFPPHPDHWQGRTEFQLVQESREFTRYNWPIIPAYICCDQTEPIRPANGTLVPPGTQQVDVTLTYDNDLPAGDVILYYHAADTRDYTQLEPDEAQGGEKRYVIPVNETMADTPYANASQWRFLVSAPRWLQHDRPGVFDGTYTLNATVHKA